MKQDFDHIAQEYDNTFTHTEIGKRQRAQVYQFLEKEIPSLSGLKTLEINGGTGEDAIWLAKKGAKVTCTDISPEMVAVAKSKSEVLGIDSIQFKTLDVKNIIWDSKDEQYDVIFSNFGGLNCLSKEELQQFLIDIEKLLLPNGKLVMVIMPSFCLWETIYFMGKLKFKKAFRRLNKKGVSANVEDETVKTYYFSPRIVNKLSPLLKKQAVNPVGFFIPPSYLEPFFNKRMKFLNRLTRLEQSVSKRSFLAPSSDHYFIMLEKNK